LRSCRSVLADEPTGNLDSKTSREFMALFRLLNDTGQTVVIITCNPENGDCPDRTIRLKDGRVRDKA
jgi:ABC-type lipoprotein export system ATPase subunit